MIKNRAISASSQNLAFIQNNDSKQTAQLCKNDLDNQDKVDTLKIMA